MRCFRVLVGFLGFLAAAAPPARADLASMVADLNVPVGPDNSSHPDSFVRVGSRVVFFADAQPGEGPVPWSTDGTPAGTVRLPGDRLALALGKVGDAYLWFARRPFDPQGHYSLWRSNGEAAGTARLTAGAVDFDEPRVLTADRLYFFRRLATLELWESDGSAAGTRRIAPLPQVGNHRVRAVAAERGGIFFLTEEVVGYSEYSGEPIYENMRLWRTDRTSGLTGLLYQSEDVGQPALYAMGGRLYFNPDGKLWRTDGTSPGTVPVSGPSDLSVWISAVVGQELYLRGRDSRHEGESLWACDGTEIRLLVRGLQWYERQDGPLGIGGRHFFVASDEEHGAELWSTRGTPATTALVADLCPGPCSAFTINAILAAAGERVFLLADDGVRGIALWVTDGSRAGTRRLLDLSPGHSSYGYLPPGLLRPDGDDVFLYRLDRSQAVLAVELWASDGTTAGTRRLAGFPLVHSPFSDSTSRYQLSAPSLAALGSRIVTLGYDPQGGFEPWVLDRHGRAGHPLADLVVGGPAAGSERFDAVPLGDRLLFMTDRGGATAAWSTRGSAETTVELAEIPRPRPPYGPPLTAVAGGIGYLDLGDLWASDGTAAGTVRLTDFAATAPGSGISTAVVDLAGRAVFGVTAGGSGATELWVSDGSPAGTRRAGLPPFSRPISRLTAVGDEVYFWAHEDVSGWQIWRADAALAGVRRLTDRRPDEPSGPDPGGAGFTRIGPHVYFTLSFGGYYSLWRTDGTPEGTRRVRTPIANGVRQLPMTTLDVQGSVLLLTQPQRTFDHLRLWAGDGSGTDWTEAKDFGPGSSFFGFVRRASGVLLDVGVGSDTPAVGDRRLYRTDGTAAGTAVVLDFGRLGVPSAGAIGSIIAAGDRFFFAAGEPGFRTAELWTSGGNRATTRRLQEIAPGARGSDPWGFVVAGSRLYFSADDGIHGRELWSLPFEEIGAPCRPSGTALCLGDGRFRAELFRHDRRGERADGRAVPWSSAAGAFWFSDYGEPEAAVKIVGGGPAGSPYRLLFGPLADTHFALTVTDLETGDSRRYPADPGPLPAFVDFAAFPGAAKESASEPEPISSAAPEVTAGAAGPCRPDAARLCLHGGRFAVGLAFADASGPERPALAFAHGDRAGYFAFHGARYADAALKILDRRAVNGRFWLFATSLTRGGYTLTVTDTETGTVFRYPKPAGETSSLIDRSSLR